MRRKHITTFCTLLLAILICTLPFSERNSGVTSAAADFRLYFPLVLRPDPLLNVNPRGQTVEFWHTLSRDGGTLTTMIEEFNQTNPWDITVLDVENGNYSDLHKSLTNAIARGDLPSMARIYPDYVAEYVTYTVVSPLAPYIDSPTWGYTADEMTDFFTVTLQSGYLPQFQERYGWPAHHYETVLYYNQDWLVELGHTQPPATWEAFEEMICQAVQQPFSGKSDNRPAIGFKYTPEAMWFKALTLSRGGEILTADGSAYLFNQSPGIETLAHWRAWTTQGCAAPAEYDYGDQEDFGAGAALFNINSSSAWPYYQKSVQDGANFQWNVAGIPQTPQSMILPVQNVWGPIYTIFKTTPEEQLAAWLFIKWVSEAQQQATIVQATGIIPTRKSTTALLTDYLAQNPAYSNILELISRRSYVEGQVIGFNKCQAAINTAISDSLAGGNIETALNEAVTACNASLTP